MQPELSNVARLALRKAGALNIMGSDRVAKGIKDNPQELMKRAMGTFVEDCT